MPEACYKLRRVCQCICWSEDSQTGHQHCAMRAVSWGVSSEEQFSGRSWLRDGSREGSAGLLPSPLHWGTRRGQSTFLAAENKHKPKQWAQSGTCFDFPLNGSLVPLSLHFLPPQCLLLLCSSDADSSRQQGSTSHIPQPQVQLCSPERQDRCGNLQQNI